MKRIAIALFAIALAACTNGQGQADVTLQNTVVFGGADDAGVALPSNVMIPNVDVTTDGEISIDCESELASMGKLAFYDLEIHAMGKDYAYVIGRWQLERDQEGGGNVSGVYSLVLRRTAVGWRIVLDHTN